MSKEVIEQGKKFFKSAIKKVQEKPLTTAEDMAIEKCGKRFRSSRDNRDCVIGVSKAKDKFIL